MNRARLAVGNPTGHEDQYAVTLSWGQYFLRGRMPLKAARQMRDALASGCRLNDVEFSVSIPDGYHRRERE